MGDRRAAGLALGVAAADLAQLAARPLAATPWPAGRWVGCLGGVALYVALAVGLARGVGAARIVAAAVPLLPLSVLAGAALGVPGPAPDAAMVAVLGLQLATAAAAVARLDDSSASGPGAPR